MRYWLQWACALLFMFQMNAADAATAALRYETAVVELKGTVTLEEHFGPPGFGEDPKTDSVELIAVLVLDEPISVDGDSGTNSPNPTSYTDVRRVQLVRAFADPPFSPYAGKHVAVSGTMYEGFTGHHHTDVLIRVETIAVR